MDIARKVVNAYIWYWVLAFVGLGLSFGVMGILHVLRFLLLGMVWI